MKEEIRRLLLVTCIDAREKYLKGLGSLSVFDEIIDITELVRNRPEYNFRPHFKDRIPGVNNVDTLNEFYSSFSSRNPSHVLFFAPQQKYLELFSLVPWLAENGWNVSFILNRHTLPSVPVLDLRNKLRQLRKSFRQKRATLKVDNIYTPHHLALAGWRGCLKPNRVIRIRHMDAPAYSSECSNYGVLIDSCFPYHKEFARHGSLDPQTFYERLERIASWAKQKFSLDEIIIALHPNSMGKERYLIRDHRCIYGETNKLISQARITFSFGSDASGISVAYKKSTYFMDFPDLLPLSIQQYIRDKSAGLGIPIINYDGENSPAVGRVTPTGVIRRWRYRQYYAATAPYLSDCLRS